MDYTFFIDSNMSSLKYVIYRTENLPIETMMSDVQQPPNTTVMECYNICIEKHKTLNLIQIRLSSASNNSSVFICTVDDIKFEEFKMEQSLYVTFEYFVKHITQMFEQSRQRKINVILKTVAMGVDLMKQQHDRKSFQLQFYEKGTLKNLVHISLPMMPAPYEVILFYLNEMYAKLQEQNQIYAQKNGHLQTELTQKNEQLERLNETVKGLKANLNEQEKMFGHRQKEQIGRLEQEFKHISDTKDFQKQELEKQITAFRARIDGLVKENHMLTEKLKTETKLTVQLRNDGKQAIDTIAELKKQLEQLTDERLSHKNNAQKNDHVLNELRKQMHDLEEKVIRYEKQNHELMAELDAEKNICQIKRNGLKMATDDICNANSIIRKQAAEIAALKEKINWRTEVALKQEQVIRDAGKGKDNLNKIFEKVETAVKKNAEQNQQTENKIKWIRNQTDLLEQKYHDKIEELYGKIQSIPTTGTCDSRMRRPNGGNYVYH